MTDGFDPYHKWLGIPPAEQPPNHYRLLGISLFESDLDVIANAADQRMSHVRTFQAGKRSAQSQDLLNEISAAKVCLLNPKKKAAYDAGLRAKGATTAPTEKPPPPLPVAQRLEPEAEVEPAPVIEGGPAVAVSSGSAVRLASARRRQAWQVWMAIGVTVTLLIGVGLFAIRSRWPEEFSQNGRNKPPIEVPKKPPQVKKAPPEKPPKEKIKQPPEKPPKEKTKEPPKPKEPLFGPVPDAAAQNEAREQLVDLLAGNAPAKLLEEADAEDRSRAQRYVLLTRAKELATADGDVKTALAVVDEMKKRFEIDEAALNTETRTALGQSLQQMAEKADTPKAAALVAENGLLLIEAAKAAGQKDLARTMAPIALATARRSGDNDLVTRATLVFLEMQKEG